MNDRYEVLLTRRVGRWNEGHVLSVTEINQFTQDQIDSGNAVVILEPDAKQVTPDSSEEDPEDQVKKPKIKKPKKGY